MMSNAELMECLRKLSTHCNNTKCYMCIAGVKIEGAGEHTHFVCGLKNKEPQDWDLSQLSNNMRDETLGGLEVLFERADLNEEEKQTIGDAISLLKD